MSNCVYYLYKIVNIYNDKVYIGITKNPTQRWSTHLSKNSSCTNLKRAMDKYGRDSFSMEILCMGCEAYISELEIKAIINYDSMRNGYNLVLGNPRTGNLALSENQRKKISEGLNKYHESNIAWNKGAELQPKKKDPVYICGFWFPNQRTGLKILGLNIKSFYKWDSEGTLGEVCHTRVDSVKDVPVYVGGFWFDCFSRASDKLSLTDTAIRKRLADGFLDGISQLTRGKVGADNHMSGRFGSLHHRSKAVMVDGLIYGSISEASRATKYTKKMIYTRIKNNHPSFGYA